MTARPAAAPRTNLVPCGNKPVHHGVITDAHAFVAGFKTLLREHGVEPGDMSDQAIADAEALAVLAATLFGAKANMPLSLHERYAALRSRINTEPVKADRRVA